MNKILFIRKHLPIMAAAMFMLALHIPKAHSQSRRSDFKKDFPKNLVARAETGLNNIANIEIDTDAQSREFADNMIDTIVNILIQKSEKLKQLRNTLPRRKFVATVRNELADGYGVVPIATKRGDLYCVRGFYNGYFAGYQAFGMKDKIIPESSSNACDTIKENWKKEFPRDKYGPGIWYEDATVYKNYEEYLSDQNDYVKQELARFTKDFKLKNSRAADESELAHMEKEIIGDFAASNAYAGELKGSIVLTRRNKWAYHATTIAGPGHKDENGNFICDESDEVHNISFNREYIEPLFKNGATKINIPFIGNIGEGIYIKMQEESAKINKMNHNDLIAELSRGLESDKTLRWLNTQPVRALRNLMLAQHFGKDFGKEPPIRKIVQPTELLLHIQQRNLLTM